MRNSDSSASSGFTSDLPVALHPRKPERLLCQPKMLAVHGSDLDAAASKGHTSGEYANAVKETNTSDEHPLRKFHKTQSLQYLGEENDRVSVPIWSLPCQPRIFLAVHGSDLDAAASKGHTSGEFANAVKETNTSDEHPLRKFYKTQSLQYLGEENDRVSVPIWIAGYDNSSSEFEDVASSWIEHIQRAISDINDAVPGLNLHTVSEKSNAIIKIAGNQKKSCFTRGRILSGGSSEIYLYSGWNNKKRTSCHELLHALGFGHEHQRPDRDYSIEIGSNTSQYKKLDDLYGVTRFDPYSIMLYPEDEKYLRRSGDPVWFTKPSHELNLKMSELDKVGVNNLYRPCKRSGYSPVIGSTGLFYCGRYIGVQSPGHDGHCGPNNGVNCPACRTLKTGRVVSLWERDKWQGWTGAIYCGYFFGVQCEGHDGYCGPNNGPQCPECYKEFLKTPSEAESSTDEEL